MIETAEEIVQKWKYATDRVHLSPYEPAAFDEDFLVLLYQQMKRDNLVELVCLPTNLNDFVSYLHARPIVVGCVKSPDYPVAGFGWLNEVEGVDGARKASFGFSFFRKHWGKPEIGEISDLALEWWFRECRIDILYGASLTFNRAARIFAARMGFTSVGILPGFFVINGEMLDAHLVYLKKEYWEKRQ